MARHSNSARAKEVEKWLREVKKAESLENPTLDKIRRVMNLVYKHGQRYGLIPRDESANPMNWVRQKTTSSYTAVIMSPRQAFEILLNIPEPRRTLVLTDAATALRVSEILGLMWMDLDFGDQVIEVKRAYVWAQFKTPKSKASKAPVPMHPVLAGFLMAWRERTPYAKDLTIMSSRASGLKARSHCRLQSWCRSICALLPLRRASSKKTNEFASVSTTSGIR